MQRKMFMSIVILSTFSLLLLSSVFFLKKSKINSEKNNIEKYLISAAKEYFTNNNYTEGYQEVTVENLIENGYVEENKIQNVDENTILTISSTSFDTEPVVSVSYVTTTSNLTFDDYTAEVSTHYSNIGVSFERYIDNEEEIFKIDAEEKVYARIEFKISNVKAGDIYVFRAKVKTEDMTGSRGAGLTSIYTKNGYSYSYSRDNVTGTSDWTTINIVLLPEYNYETETEENAKILVSLSIGGMTNNNEYVTGTAYFKDFELINAENAEDVAKLASNEQLIITESENKKIKVVDYLEERNNYDITDEILQTRINLLEEVYDGYAELVSNSSKTEKLMYPFNNTQLVIIGTNHLYIAYGALANNPILVNYDSRKTFNLYNKIDNSFNFGYLHEMGHTFDHILTSTDSLVKSSGGKWNFHSELWANMKIPYVLTHKNITVDWGTTNWDYNGLMNYLKNDYSNFEKNTFNANGLEYIIFTALTDQTTNEVNWDAIKKTHQWFNDSNFEFSNNNKRLLYYLAKLDEFSNNSFKNNILARNLNIIKEEYGFETVNRLVVRTQTIPKNSNTIQPFKVDSSNADIIYSSSDESLALINENGIVETFDKEGIVTLTAKSYFTDDLNQSIEVEVGGNINYQEWNISNNENSYVIAKYDPNTQILTLDGTGETKGYWDDNDRPWKEFEPYIKKIIINDGITLLNNFLFQNCTALETVDMADSVKTIGMFTFANTTSLQTINFSKNLIEIKQRALSESGIKSLILPESIEIIGSNICWKCKNLQEIYIPNKTIEYGSNPFLSANINIPVIFAGKTNVEIADFDLIKRVMDSNDILYSQSVSFVRSSYNSKTGLVNYKLSDAKNGNGKISISSGFLAYSTINLIPEIVPLDHIEITNSPNKINYIEGENFDSEGLVVKAVYQNENGIHEDVITNFVLSNNKNLQPGQTEVVISYTFNGIKKTVKQKINVYEKLEINIKNYTMKNIDGINYIEKIKSETTINEFLTSIETNGNVKFSYNNYQIDDYEEFIFTDLDLEISLGEQKEIYKLVVKGDLNGDSKVNTGDILRLYRYSIDKNRLLTDASKRAAKINEDELINLDDVLNLYDYVLGIKETLWEEKHES